MNEPPGGPRRPDDDDWESRLPDEWEPIHDPRPRVLLRLVALVVVVALLAATAPLVLRLLFGDPEAPPASSGDGTIVGQVLAGPQCPVLVAGSPCPDQPIQTEVTVSQGGRVFGVTTTDEHGEFHLVLQAGTYVLTAGSTDKPFPRGTPTDVTVEAGRVVTVRLQVDTGIR